MRTTMVAAVAGDDGERRRQGPVGDGDAGVGRDRHRRGDAGHDLERHAGGGQGLGLLAAPPEHERVAALEAYDALAPQSPLHEQGVDLLLGHGRTRRLPHVDPLGAGRRQVQQGDLREPVVHHHVGPGQQLGPPAREQAGVARPRPHQVHGH